MSISSSPKAKTTCINQRFERLPAIVGGAVDEGVLFAESYSEIGAYTKRGSNLGLNRSLTVGLLGL